MWFRSAWGGGPGSTRRGGGQRSSPASSSRCRSLVASLFNLVFTAVSESPPCGICGYSPMTSYSTDLAVLAVGRICRRLVGTDIYLRCYLRTRQRLLLYEAPGTRSTVTPCCMCMMVYSRNLIQLGLNYHQIQRRNKKSWA